MADISKIKPNGAQGTEYDLKDTVAMSAIENTNRNIQSSITVPKAPVVTVTDATAINAEDITVDITPIQDLHGYDHPWAGGAGKNKLPMTSHTDIMTFAAENATGSVRMTGTAQSSGWANGIYISMSNLPAGDYIVSCEQNPDHMNVLVNWAFWEISPNGTPITVAQGDTVRFAWMVEAGQAYDCSISGLMLRLATETDATFESYSNECPIEGRAGAEMAVATPYQGEQYTASFGETVYGGKWHVTEGGTDNEMAEVDLGDLSWTYTSGYGGLFYAPVPDAKYSGSRSLIGYDCYSSHYKSKGNTPWTQLSNGEINVGSDTAGAGKPYVNVKDNRYSDATTFKSAMNGVQLVYELETPTTISTRKQNVPMLKGINTVSADCGDVSLKYQPDNVIGELKGEIQRANSFVDKMALRKGSGAKDFSYGGWSFRLYIYRSMGQISMSVERISASNVTEQAVVKVFNGESDYRAPEDLRPIINLIQAATYTTPSGWSIQVYLKDDGYIMFTGIAPEVGASAPTSSNWNLVEPWATHQQAKDLFNN